MKLNISISDLANIATIVSVPLTILTWLLTRDHFTKFWKKWLKWILTIVVVIGIVGLWHMGWLNWLQYRFPCPVWVLILLPLAGLAIVSCIIAAIALLDRTPDRLSYLSDHIFGVEWHWQCPGGKLREYSLVPYCPKSGCSCQLDPREMSGYQAIGDISLVCDHCGFRKDFDCNWDELKWKVIKEIDRRIRTGEFKEML
jgi:hypothetical protein